MTYVWIKQSEGSMRYVNDIYLPPCNGCGERVSTCTCNEPKEENDMCASCNGRCVCDYEYDRMREKENEETQDYGNDED
jgi:hypothetical protein